MTRSEQKHFTASNSGLKVAVMTAAFVLALFAGQPAKAQTFEVIHTFTGGGDGSNPVSGLTFDRGGNLYGGTGLGGNKSEYCGPTCGMIFKMVRTGSSWIYQPLYLFVGMEGGPGPSRITIGPNGSLYGLGGDAAYNLTPPPTRCISFVCQWNDTVLWTFCCGADSPGGLTFDQAGNMYSGSEDGGEINHCSGGLGCGFIFQLVPTSEGWTYNVIYEFHDGNQGAHPTGELIVDSSGNLYGTTAGLYGGDGNGNVFKLTPSQAGYWNETVLYTFQGGSDGRFPQAGVIFDSKGNLYGASSEGGANNGGTVFELTAANGWAFNLLYSLPASQFGVTGVNASMIMDSAGNLYGTTFVSGAYNLGSVFKLTHGSGGWTYTDLHDFTGASDGAYPVGSLVMDSNGNIYGAAEAGGSTSSNCDVGWNYQCGVLFEITPN
ncbi:MAG: choice-of-anchor tandem repeat GloVer-containing protein [Candidatus Korobacteraceae bacterium]|jgi:uncharacterized repeat protein (TIGR03803 family)